MLNEPKISTILRELSREKAFYFFTSIGNYTGHRSVSLEEFAKEILEVNVKSLEFHLYRGDFEKWIAQTLEDSGLARKIRELRDAKSIGMDLRDRLYLIVSKHFENLRRPQPALTPTGFSKQKATSVTFGRTLSQENRKTRTQE